MLVFVTGLVVLWLSAHTGAVLAEKRGMLDENERADLSIVLNAALTLLALIIGFTFSMAATRYNQRKDYEAAEANSVETEYARAGLLSVADAQRLRELMRMYLKQRISFYILRDVHQLDRLNTSNTQIQLDLWSVVQGNASAHPTVLAALIMSGMNEMLSTQAYTRASWKNRIPIAAWALMAAIAVSCNCLIGYTARRPQGRATRLLLLPMIVSISFFLIAELDSPRGGTIPVSPKNLEDASQLLGAQ